MNPIIERLGWTLVHSLWQGALVWAALQLALVGLRHSSAQARYLLGVAALALAAALPWATYFYLDVTARIPTAAIHFTAGGVGNVTFLSNRLSWWQSRFGADLPMVFPYLIAIWALGCAFGAARLTAGWRSTRELAQRWEHVPAAIALRLNRLAQQLGIRRAVAIGESILVQVPSVVGWFKPIILLPSGALAGLSSSQIDALLAHELAHILRHDFAVNLLQSACEVLFFYHPAIWSINASIRREREHACDDIAVGLTGDARSYAEALLRLEEARIPELVLAASGGTELLERIRRILTLAGGPGTSKSSRSVLRSLPVTAWAAFAGVGLYVVTLGVIPGVTARALAENAPPATSGQAIARVVQSSDPQITISIQGQIRNPGRYSVSAGSKVTLGQAIVAAGGFTERSKANAIRITRLMPDGSAQVTTHKINPKNLDADPGSASNPFLLPGEIVFVPTRTI